ncbi:MAG: metal-binding protein [Methyloprofundus sp.]|nr:metal-binding protein [Methyloprofundus sp.]
MLKQDVQMCDLCGLVVEIDGFTVDIKEGKTLKFCCAGCLSVYRLLNGDNIVE